MLPAIHSPRHFAVKKENRLLRNRVQQSTFLRSEGINPDHVSLIPRDFYVVETNAIPKYSNQYASTFNGTTWETVIFPSLEPHTRREVLLLKSAMHKMEEQLDGATPTTAYTAEHSEKEWAMYTLCFGELIRQMKFICRDQSLLLHEIKEKLNQVFQRVLVTMKAMETSAAAAAEIAVNQTPSTVSVFDEDETSAPNELSPTMDDNEHIEFVCSYCYEVYRDPKVETRRRSTMLGSLMFKRLSIDISSDMAKLRAVVQLQSVYRGYRTRVELDRAARIQQRFQAAVCIQRNIRAFIAVKRAAHRRRVLLVWMRRLNQVEAVRRIQRAARRFLERTRNLKQAKLADVVSQFRLVNHQIAEKMHEKAQQVKKLLENVQGYDNQVRDIEAILHEEETEATPQPTSPTKHHMDAVCASVSRGLRLIHERTARLRAREDKLKEELEVTLRQVQEMKVAGDAADATADDDADDEDDWHLDDEDTMMKRIDSMPGNLRPRFGRTLTRRDSSGSNITSAPDLLVPMPPPPRHHHATILPSAVGLLARLGSATNVNIRSARPLAWLKTLMYEVYDEITDPLPPTATSPLHFALWLSQGEFHQVRQNDISLISLSDAVYEHFQCRFGLPALIDQAVSDLVITMDSYSSSDSDVVLFQAFLNGARPLADLRFLCHLRSLLRPLELRAYREVVEMPQALKVAYSLFRVAEEPNLPSTDLPRPSALFALFQTQLPSTEHIHLTDLFDLLCKFHADARLECLYDIWITEKFLEIDLDGDNAISPEEFVRSLERLPHAPTTRELRQIFSHATYTCPKDIKPRMSLELFRTTCSRLLRNKQLIPGRADDQGLNMSPVKRRQLVHNIQLVRAIARCWHDKKDLAQEYLDKILDHSGLLRNLVAYLVHLRGELERVLLSNHNGALEHSMRAWNIYSTIVSVLLVLHEGKRGEHSISAAVTHLVELEKVWKLHASFKDTFPKKEDAVSSPSPVIPSS
ncbi:unnamed protein product [Aphanomyces euteiches]